MITVYTIAYNEEVIIQFLIDHYRSRFPGCRIVVFDNISTDSTAQIALSNNCEVIPYDTNNQIKDSKYLEIKNNCWKSARTDWVLVCDADELLDINEESLKKEESCGVTAISSEAYNMINIEDNYDLPNIKYGSRCSSYDKTYLFNKKFISDINYDAGCHTCHAAGSFNKSEKSYLLYHYKCINPDLHIARYKSYQSRLSPENKKNGWGYHYNQTEADIRNSYPIWRAAATKIRE
jgi:glycosyltransferase involved in cell wall biosynthesis